MALPILDGNQSATTLSTIITGGAHIPAHTVVSLGTQAKSDITSAISGSVVSISNFPSTQTISGTVTANVQPQQADDNDPNWKFIPIGFATADAYNLADQWRGVSQNAPLPVSNYGSVTIGSLPAISGTVTANVSLSNVNGGPPPSGFPVVAYDEAISGGAQIVPVQLNTIDGTIEPNNPLPISGTVTVGNSVTIGSLPAISGTVTARLQDASGNNLTSTSIGGVQRLNVSLASAATPGGSIPTFVNVYGGSDSGTVRALAVDSSGRTVVTVSNFPATQAVSLASTTVTVSALPSGALTTRFGSVTTANLSQITSAVTNTSRKYLLAQNISAGTVTIGIGFSPTTTQGIQLTAGAGLTFDAFCPTGAVYWLGAVTGAAFTILEG